MKRLFLFILFIVIAGYFGTGYFNGPALATTPNEVLLKDKRLQQAFKTIVKHEEIKRVPADAPVVDEPEVEVSRVIDTAEPEGVEYDLHEDTYESLTAEITDLELKIGFYKSRNESDKAEAAVRRVEFLKSKLQYLPESE